VNIHAVPAIAQDLGDATALCLSYDLTSGRPRILVQAHDYWIGSQLAHFWPAGDADILPPLLPVAAAAEKQRGWRHYSCIAFAVSVRTVCRAPGAYLMRYISIKRWTCRIKFAGFLIELRRDVGASDRRRSARLLVD